MSVGRRAQLAKRLAQHVFTRRTVDVALGYLNGVHAGHVPRHVAEAMGDVMAPLVDVTIEQVLKGRIAELEALKLHVELEPATEAAINERIAYLRKLGVESGGRRV